MDNLANPGLLHVLQKIYLNLDSESLNNCALLSKSLALPMKDPRFWHKMCLLKRQDPVKTLKGLFQLINQNKEAREEFSLVLKTLYTGRKKIDNNLLHFVASGSLYHIVQLLISNGANVNAEDVNGNTPLHLAGTSDITALRTVKTIEVLISAGADIHARNSKHQTPLYLAIMYGNLKAIELLLQNGASFFPSINDSETPWDLALRSSQTKSFEIILNYIENNYAKEHLGPILLRAVKSNQVKACEMLIRIGANVDCDDYQSWDGFKPLHWAVFYNNLQLVELLVKHEASVNTPTYFKESPLHLAIMKGHKDIVKILLGKISDVNLETLDNCLSLSIKNKKIELVKMIVEAGATLNNPVWEMTPLYQAFKEKQFEIAKLLILLGANANFRFQNGASLLHHAVSESKDKIVQILIEGGACLSLKNGVGNKPIETALRNDINVFKLISFMDHVCF